MTTKTKELKVERDPSVLTPMVRVGQNSLVLEGDPEKQVVFAQKAAKALMSVVKSKKTQVLIQGKQYLTFDDWQLVARFYGASVAVEWTKPVEKSGKVFGYEARANVLRNGEVIGSAEALCTRDERNWANRDEFALKSMSQTRASAKALRNVFSWVVVMAGYEGTPAEEMTGVPKVSETDKQQKGVLTLANAIKKTTDVKVLKEYLEKIKKSDKYTEEQKVDLGLLIEQKVEELTQNSKDSA